MRKKGFKWAVGLTSIAALVVSVIMISNYSHAQGDDAADEVKMETTLDVDEATADMDGMDMKDCCAMDKVDCSNFECNNCSMENCENCTAEECEAFCKSACEDKAERIEEGDC